MQGGLVSRVSEEGFGGGGKVRGGVGRGGYWWEHLGGACLLSEQSERGRLSGAHMGGSGVNCSSVPQHALLFGPLLLVYLMFHPPPSRCQYSV